MLLLVTEENSASGEYVPREISSTVTVVEEMQPLVSTLSRKRTQFEG